MSTASGASKPGILKRHRERADTSGRRLAMHAAQSALIAQPDRLQLPLKVPAQAEAGGLSWRSEVLGSTANVLLLQGEEDVALPALGTPIRLRLDWDRQMVIGRLAANGVAGRFLVTVGERAIRRSRRFPVSLPGVLRSPHFQGAHDVRVTDLSAGGARVEGIELPLGAEMELRFTPPGRSTPVDVQGFVVRFIEGAQVPTIGIAFRLGQPMAELLGGPASITPGR